MTVFACSRCKQRLSADLREVPLPPPVVEEAPSAETFLPPWMQRGTYATNQHTGEFVLHPDDVSSTTAHPEPRRSGGCCGLDGLSGPNLVCDNCGAEVATQYSDCWSQQYVGLVPEAVVTHRATRCQPVKE